MKHSKQHQDLLYLQYIAKKKISLLPYRRYFHVHSLCLQSFLFQWGVNGMVKHYKSQQAYSHTEGNNAE